jgi:hypothetical protein
MVATPRVAEQTLAFFVRMNPEVRRDFPRFGQLNHVDRRLIAARSAGSASERPFKFPDRRIPRSTDGIKRYTGAGFATAAFDFHPTVTAVEALADRRGRLRRSPERFHLDRPCYCVISLLCSNCEKLPRHRVYGLATIRVC